MSSVDRRPLLATILAVLLISTTPIGTGGGVHQFDLVHPLFSHLHLYQGRLLTHEQLESALTRTTAPVGAGPALGAGSVSATGDAGLALSPTLPPISSATLFDLPARAMDLDVASPRDRVEAPPDPPPTAAFAS